MSLFFIIPGLISLFLVTQRRIGAALLSVYLPCLLLMPDGWALRMPHLPPLSAAEFALFPLAAVGFIRLFRSGSFAFMDVLVFLYAASVAFSEIRNEPVLNDGIFAAILAVVSMLFAYVVGRQLIEPDLRIATVKRIVVLILLNGPTNLFEWRMGQSLHGIIGWKVFGIVAPLGSGMQIRNGRGRIGAVFGGGECAGIAFAMTFCLNAWLVFLRKAKARVDFGSILGKLEKHHVVELILLVFVFATQSRGPEIALCAGILILQMTRVKRIKPAMIVVAATLLIGFLGTKAYFDSYTNSGDPVNEQQSSAMYRKQMNMEYAPIAEAGGWTGYSVPMIPFVDGMTSIDNNYLLVHLAWGRLAYYLFLLIAFENVRVLVMRCWRSKALEDRAFMIAMLAAMTVLWVTLMTVFLGAQLPSFSFLLIGWIQAAVKERPKVLAQTETSMPAGRFVFRRVFT